MQSRVLNILTKTCW